VEWLLRNNSVSGATIKGLKREDGLGPGIERLADAIDYVFIGPGAPVVQEPIFQGVNRQVFFNSYPTFDDENNLSMVVFLKCHGMGVMFPGDLERVTFVGMFLLSTRAWRLGQLRTNNLPSPCK
jgi:hypothetical protein